MAHHLTSKPIGLIPPRPPPELYSKFKVAKKSSSTSQESSTDSCTSVKDSKHAHRTSKSVSQNSSPNKSKPGSAKTSTNVMYEREIAPHPPGGHFYHGPAGLVYNAHATMPPPLQGISPLAVYHICRVCLRPRSGRYHREHPIPIDGIPPPPGICRRCRVTSVEEVVPEAELVKVKESNDVKLGVRCLVPDEDYVPGKGIASTSNPRLIDQSLQTATKGKDVRKDIPYRYVKVVEVSPSRESKLSSGQNEKSQASALPAARLRKYKTSSAVSSLYSEPHPAHVLETDDETRVTITRRDSVTEPTSIKSSANATSTDATSMTRQHTTIHYCDKPTAADVRRIASEEVKRSHQKIMKEIEKGLTESEVAKIAREQVDRYRQAERKIAAHEHAYAYGRMIPMERRISSEPAEAIDKPWDHDLRRDFISRQSPSSPKSMDDPKIKETIIVSRNSYRAADNLERSRSMFEDADYFNFSGPSKAAVQDSEQSQWKPKDRAGHPPVNSTTRRVLEGTAPARTPGSEKTDMKATATDKYDSTLREETTRVSRPNSGGLSRQRSSGQKKHHVASSLSSDEDYWSDEKTTWPTRSWKFPQVYGSRPEMPHHPNDSARQSELWPTDISGRPLPHAYSARIHSPSKQRPASTQVFGTTRAQCVSCDECERRPVLSMPSPRDFAVSPGPSLQPGSRIPGESPDGSYLYAKHETERVDTIGVDKFGRRPGRDHTLTTETIYRERFPGRGRASERQEDVPIRSNHDYKSRDSSRVEFANPTRFTSPPPVSNVGPPKFRELRNSHAAPRDYPPSDLSIDAPRSRRHTVSSSGYGSRLFKQNPMPFHPQDPGHRRRSLSRPDRSPQQEGRRADASRPPITSGSKARTSEAHPSRLPFSESPARERVLSTPKGARPSSAPYSRPKDRLSSSMIAQDGSQQAEDEEAAAKAKRRRSPGKSGWRRPV